MEDTVPNILHSCNYLQIFHWLLSRWALVSKRLPQSAWPNSTRPAAFSAPIRIVFRRIWESVV